MTTKEKIKESLLKILERYPADEVTLKLFCADTGISKQTLYNHYRSLMGALEDAYRSEFKAHLADCDDYLKWVEEFRALLDMLKSKRNICLHLYFSSRQEDFVGMIEKYGATLIQRGIEDCSRDQNYEVSEKDKAFMLRFYMYIFMGIIKDFFENKMREDTAYIAKRCDAMLRFHIRNSLKNIRDQEKGAF